MYTVIVLTEGEERKFRGTQQAIECWMGLSGTYEFEVGINAETETEARDLLKWVDENRSEFRELYKKSRCPYSLDWLLQECRIKHTFINYGNKRNPMFICHPFTIG